MRAVREPYRALDLSHRLQAVAHALRADAAVLEPLEAAARRRHRGNGTGATVTDSDDAVPLRIVMTRYCRGHWLGRAATRSGRLFVQRECVSVLVCVAARAKGEMERK